MKTRVLNFAAALVLLAAVSPASANLIIDPNFDSPSGGGSFATYFANGSGAGNSFSAWTVTTGSVDLIGGYWQAPLGGGSVDLDGDSVGAISQTFIASAGNYILTFDLSGNPDGGSPTKTVQVSVGTAVQDYTFTLGSNGQSGHSPMGYVPETLSFTWTGGPTALTFTSLDNPESPYGPVVGAVSVSAVPELATWGMMLLGFASIGFIAYRRTKKRSAAFTASV